MDINLLSLLPPELFPTEIQPIIYFTLLPLAVGILLLGYLILWIYAPKNAKMYFFNKWHKLPIVDFETDDGIRGQETVKPHSEGIAIGTQTRTPYLFPRPINNDMIMFRLQPELAQIEKQLSGKKNPATDKPYTNAEIEKILNDYIDDEVAKVKKMESKVLKVSVDKDLGVPVYRTYWSRVIATTLAHIIGLENPDETTKIAIPLIKKTRQHIEPIELNLDKDKNTDAWVCDVHLPVDPKTVKKWFPDMWTPSQLKASNRISEDIGRTENEGVWKKYLMIFIVFGALFTLFMVFALLGSG